MGLPAYNGSEQVIQQFVWGAMYIDELVEIAVNDDPIGDSDFSESENFRGYYTQHNANFNVIGLADAAGNLVERYEYTPYGQRQVYKVAGANDPDAHAPMHISSRVEVSSVPGVSQPYALNPFGHQGLFHDEESGLIQNRDRMLHPRLGRFIQRDPIGSHARVSPRTVNGSVGSNSFGFIPRDAINARPSGTLSPGRATGFMPRRTFHHATTHFVRQQDVYADAVNNAIRKLEPTVGASASKSPHLWQYADGMNLYQYAGSNPTNRMDPSGLNNVTIHNNCKNYADFLAIVPEEGNNPITPVTPGNTYDADGIFLKDEDWGWKLTDNCWGTLKCNCNNGQLSIDFEYTCWPWWLGGVTGFPKNQNPFGNNWPW